MNGLSVILLFSWGLVLKLKFICIHTKLKIVDFKEKRLVTNFCLTICMSNRRQRIFKVGYVHDILRGLHSSFTHMKSVWIIMLKYVCHNFVSVPLKSQKIAVP